MTRRILHLDMDAFYASVEQTDRPELKGRPVIVGGSTRGVVSTASYEARTYGVHSAMPIFRAKRLCPQGVFLPVRMARYKEVSRLLMELLRQVSPLVQQISIDEAYIDITGTEALHGPPRNLARKIKEAIRDSTSLTCSIGIAPNKLLAKIASDLKKPDGLTIIEEADVAEFLRSVSVKKIPGIGPKTAPMLKELGIEYASDILRFPLPFWIKRLGKHGAGLYEKAQGIDRSPVVSHSDPKSCSAEDTFSDDTADIHRIEKRLMAQCESVGRELREDGIRGKTITLKIKYADFRVVTRSQTLHEPTNCTQVIFDAASRLLSHVKLQKKVRLVGVRVSGLRKGLWQSTMFSEGPLRKHQDLDRAMDKIHGKYGSEAIKRGRNFDHAE